MLWTILAIIAVVIAGILIFAATKPDVFRVQRSATIAAPADKIFPHLLDFQRWPSWSPYEKKDPDMKRTFSGPATGPGAIYEWDGDKNVGMGRIEITEAMPNARLAFNLDMLKPFEAHNKGEFTLQPGGKRHSRHLGHVRPLALSRQDHAPVLQHGPHGRRRFREGPRRPEGDFREISAQSRRDPMNALVDAQSREVTLTRVFDAPLQQVWTAWTDPRHMAQWWGPKVFTNPVCEL